METSFSREKIGSRLAGSWRECGNTGNTWRGSRRGGDEDRCFKFGRVSARSIQLLLLSGSLPWPQVMGLLPRWERKGDSWPHPLQIDALNSFTISWDAVRGQNHPSLDHLLIQGIKGGTNLEYLILNRDWWVNPHYLELKGVKTRCESGVVYT